MWISLNKCLLDVVRIDPPELDSGFWSISVYDANGCRWSADYSNAASADMAFLKARQFILRGKTDEGKNLLVWPMEHMASDMDSESLDALAKQTQMADGVSISGEDPMDVSWKLDGRP